MDDILTSETIKEFYDNYEYISDPHTATSLNILNEISNKDINISLACAHPSKFPKSINDSIGVLPAQPRALEEMMNIDEKFIRLKNDMDLVKDYIIKNI